MTERLPERPRGGLVPWRWVAAGAAGALAVVLLAQFVLSVVFGLARVVLIVAVLAAIAWLVLVGRPGRARRQRSR